MQAIRGIATLPSARARPIGLRASRGEALSGEAAGETEGERDDGASRALVPIRPVAPIELTGTARPYPLASFLAHLIAVRERAPQTRSRGRATPGEATAAYATRQLRAAYQTDHLRKSA
jgi:hypothetical protein